MSNVLVNVLYTTITCKLVQFAYTMSYPKVPISLQCPFVIKHIIKQGQKKSQLKLFPHPVVSWDISVRPSKSAFNSSSRVSLSCMLLWRSARTRRGSQARKQQDTNFHRNNHASHSVICAMKMCFYCSCGLRGINTVVYCAFHSKYYS